MIPLDTKAHGSVPFWFWNGDQQESEITRQLELAAGAGLNGMAVHARKGNQTEYMSKRWIELIRHSCDEAKRLGLKVWLYDEEGFPSGTVGHRLQKNNPFYQQKHLRFAYVSASEAAMLDNLVAVYDAKTFERLEHRSITGSDQVLIFQMQHVDRYVDALKRETAERFMEMTHRKYFNELGDYFGDPITHIYTDDLSSNLGGGDSLPYTETLLETFTNRLGYDLLDHLPKLVENLPGCETVRLDFRKLVLDLFLGEFVEPMHAWCREHGLLFTGHLCGDEGPFEKSIHRFGAAMPFYEYEDIPGVDDFLCSTPDGCYLDRLLNHRGHSIAILVKQATSVANQLKNGICGGEVLTFLGWGAPVWGQAALLNVELALGINVFTHHDFSYATGGVTKRDCPPSYFFQQPYWPEYKVLLDALARSSQLLKRGTYAANVVVLHPMSAGWIAMDGDRICCNVPFKMQTDSSGYPHPGELEESLAEISNELLKRRIGFDYGDEWLMAKHATVADGLISIGDMHYDTVIIPPMHNLLGSTVPLLKQFAEVGGKVVVIDPPASCLVDGQLPDTPIFGTQLNPTVINNVADLNTLELKPECELDVETGAAIVCHTRTVEGQLEHYLVNVSAEDQPVSWKGPQIVYDPVSNQCIEADGTLTLPPFHGIHLLNDAPETVETVPISRSVFALAPMPGSLIADTDWCITLDQPNLFLIDWCDLPDGRFAYHTDKETQGHDILSVTIDVPDPDAVTGILGEAVTLDTLRINGTPLPKKTINHPSSQDMVIAAAGGLFKAGNNLIEFNSLDTRHPTRDVVFEPFYLMGDFGVDLVETENGMRPRMTELSPGLGDLVEQGLPFYWGSVIYEAELEISEDAEWLDAGDVDGVLAMAVNSGDSACRFMPPYRFYIGEAVNAGSTMISLTLSNTAQNLYGPHRGNYSVTLEPCLCRGNGNGAYCLASFGIDGPIYYF